jgi:hypothetical protein
VFVLERLSFYLDEQFDVPRYVPDHEYHALGAWLIADISAEFLVCLDALAMADDVRRGREPFEEWSSDGYEVRFTPETFFVRNVLPGRPLSTYPMGYVRDTLEDYWRFLRSLPESRLVREYRPDLPEWQAALLRWEEKWQLTHPYRGRLF